MASKPKTKTAPKGRPLGRENYDYESAVQIPAACPRCHSTELAVVPGAPALRRSIPTTHQGVAYAAVVWQRKVCKCGQRVTVRELLPAKK
jgi:hypothetical protein